MNHSQNGRFCPYRGLQPFTAQEKEYFFGREGEIEVVTANLKVAPLTILYGASGVGKTSMLMAGVLTRIQNEKEAAVIVFRNWQDAEFVSGLRKETLLAIERVAGDITIPESDSFIDFLQACTEAFSGYLLFIFDQFEEYFLYHGSNGTASDANASQPDFDVELARAINRRGLRTNFLFSLREDGLSKLDRLQTRIPNLLGNLVRLDHLNLPAAREAIRKPLGVYNRKSGTVPVKIENKLVDKLLTEVQTGQVTLNEGGSSDTLVIRDDKARIETSFLQLVLERLWFAESERWKSEPGAEVHWLRTQPLDDLKGASSIVRRHLDDVMDSLGDLAQQQKMSISLDTALALAAQIFRFLVTPGESKVAHTPDALASFAELSASEHQNLNDVLNLLSLPTVRVLRKIEPLPGKTEVRYEIYHDVLAPAIRDWRARYIDAERAKTLEQERKDAAIKLRNECECADAEARFARGFRYLSYALGIVCLIALAAGGVAWGQTRRAHRYAEESKTLREQGKKDREAGDEARRIATEAKAETIRRITEANIAGSIARAEQEKARRATGLAETATTRAALATSQAAAANLQASQARLAYQTDRLLLQASRLSRSYAGREEALKKFNQVLREYRKANNKEGERETLVDTGRVYVDLGQWTEAADVFDQAIQLSSNPVERASMNAEIGTMYQDSAYASTVTRKLALSYFKESLVYYAKVGDKANQAAILVKIGQVNGSESWYGAPDAKATAMKESISALESAAMLYRNLGDVSKEAGALFTAGDALSFGNPDDAVLREAQAYFNRALSAFQGARDNLGQINTLNKLISVDSRLKNSQAANAHRVALASAYEKNNDFITAAGIFSDMAYAPLQAGGGPAIDYLKKSEQLLDLWAATPNHAGKDLESAAGILRSAGIGYSQLNDLPDTRRVYMRALEYYRLANSPPLQIFFTLNYLVTCLRDLNDLTSERSYLTQGIALANQITEPRDRIFAFAEIGKRYLDLGDTANAATYIQSALSQAHEFDPKQTDTALRMEIYVLRDVGKYYVSVGMEEMGRRFFAEAREKETVPSAQATGLRDLGDFYSSRQNYAAALEYYESAAQVCRDKNLSPLCERYMLDPQLAVYRKRN